ncbi:MAG: hypothetical protein Q8830_03780, partial [Candidatus Phytoplasma australasiaticum]|nr:hypothetical protein [Candidatus Phytoplasma australasiaticum]
MDRRIKESSPNIVIEEAIHIRAHHQSATTSKPEKKLLLFKNNTGGRNNRGVITVRGHGGGAKQKIRL